ncbi:hypothetical protein MMC25_003678 [Agyrium rufum]|nr:hypothetical protein [Agyrium rufum]
MDQPAPSNDTGRPIPILLLKNQSQPRDSYETHFAQDTVQRYAPTFVPVLSHAFVDSSLERLSHSFQSFASTYSGLIVTSQRAVEALSSVLESLNFSNAETTSTHKSLSFPIYTVGPATSRAIETVRDTNLPKCSVEGKDTGNGEALAAYILARHHTSQQQQQQQQPSADEGSSDAMTERCLPLLFLVGDQRRDVILKTLQDPALSPTQRIQVSELTVYATTTSPSFHSELATALTMPATSAAQAIWIIVFSPAGCEALLRQLGWIEGDRLTATNGARKDNHLEHKGYVGKRDDRRGEHQRVERREEKEAIARKEKLLRASRRERGESSVYVTTIGPTTRDYLWQEFGFVVDASATKPSPEGVRAAIENFEHGKS